MKLTSRISMASLSFVLGAGMWIGCGGDDSNPVVKVADSGTPDHVTPGVDSGPPVDRDSGPPAEAGGDTAPPPDSGPAATMFAATLTGGQETPPVTTTASGTATFTLSADKTMLTYDITHTATGGSAAHIHVGAGGEAGAVVFPITPFSAHMTGTLTLTAAQATDLENGNYYVNIHTATNANGELRGQIMPPGATLWVATLTGGQETPAVITTGTGTAAVILNSAKDKIRFHIKTSLTPVSAHIHNNIATLSGPVVYPLAPAASVIDGDQAFTAANATDLADGHFYVNIHTATQTNGELRGQLIKPGEILYSAAMSGTNELPTPVVTAATGGGQFILTADGLSLRYEIALTGVTATSAHIHTGTPTTASGAVAYALTLAPPGAKGTQAITPADVLTLNTAGGGFYANVHSQTNGGGELRGEILKQ